MAGRRPLVMAGGSLAELPAGDWITNPVGGWVDCSQLTTAAAINAAANPANCGPNATIWLGPRATALVVDEPLIVWGSQTWLGAGGRELHTTLAAGSSLGAGLPIMCSEGWYNDAGDADEPVIIRGIKFDLNGKTGRHGLVIFNFWSHVDDCQFTGASGSGVAHLLATDTSRSGTQSSNSHSENRYTALRFDTTANGAMHFYSKTTNGISNQDGHLVDSFFAGASGRAIVIERAAGWTVANNHLYGCGDNAIDLTKCYATKVIGNYIEDFGTNNVTTGPTGGYYTGINLTDVLDGKPSVCALNTVSLAAPVSTPVYNRATCIGARAGSTQTKARLVLVGNTVALDSGSGTKSEAWRLGEGGDSGRTLWFTWAGNETSPRGTFAAILTRDNTTTRQIRDPGFVRAYTGVTGTITLDADGELVQDFTCTGAVTVNPPSSLAPARDPLRLQFLASGAQRVITFNASIRLGTGLSSRAFTVPSGEALFAALEWSDLLSDWVITAATISAN